MQIRNTTISIFLPPSFSAQSEIIVSKKRNLKHFQLIRNLFVLLILLRVCFQSGFSNFFLEDKEM